ncbi:MAG: DUF1232 domain-containing protein, partial [Deltaproteobacteria bacterium]|nr:DUF1232 domain-containing protein [Deltaproteobacteria bacterium]
PQQRKNYDRILRFSKGKAFDQYVNDKSFSRKIEKASGVLKEILDDVKGLYHLFKDAISGKFKIQPVNLGIIGGGLLYFIIPTDLIPDFIPMIGFLDDATVLTTIIKALQGEIAKYRKWKDSN